MAKFPEPPPASELVGLRRPEDVVAVAPITALARIYQSGGEHPTQWNAFRTVGPLATARFDPHPVTPDGRPASAQGHGVLYTGLSLRTALAESFQATRVVDRHSGAPWLVVFRPARPLHLLDLAGTWPTRAGASQAISSGSRPRARAWAREIFAAYPDVDGLWYRSSMDSGAPAVCLWERGASALPPRPWVHLPLNAAALALPIARACRALGYRLV